ncbi:MAG: hypothetical protein QNK23_00875 [Crocinitomicaceae bacterium]|nr:hypothetical protein [Crocinitomicaceae bacterium]
MSSSIDGVLERKVFPHLLSAYRPTLNVSGSEDSKIRYTLTFNDDKFLEIDLISDGSKLESHFVKTDIVHIDTLSMVLSGLSEGLKSNESELILYFRVRLKEAGSN